MRAAILIIIGLTLNACQSIEPSRSREFVSDTPVKEKNYQINVPQNAYVGAQMIRVKEYYTVQNTSNNVIANSDFVISPTLGFSKSGQKGNIYNLLGTTVYNGNSYRIIPMDEIGIMIDENGKPIDSIINLASGLNNVLAYGISVSPPDLTFRSNDDVSVDKSKAFINYELLYSGIDGDTIRINYREYSPDDLARAAFFQDLTYPANQSEIRFRDLKLQILSADSQHIRFSVVED